MTLENMMTGLIPGKRYRVTVEGTAISADELPLDGSGEYEGRACLYNNVLGFAKIELLPDTLPTTPGSVICSEGAIYMRREQRRTDYPWVDLDGDIVSDSAVVGATVLFDAGKEF